MKNSFYIIALIFFVFLTIGIAYLFYNFLQKPPDITKFPPIGSSEELIEEYDLLIISENTPKQILYVDYYLNPKTKKLDYGAAFYYNGEKWIRDLLQEHTLEFLDKESLNEYVSTVEGEVEIDNKVFKINIPEIYTPMTIRAEQNFTKFGGVTNEADTYLTIDGSRTFGPSKAMLLKGYNSDSFTISHKNYGINTYWLMFLDNEGNFWHFDETDLKKKHPKYGPHTFFSILNPVIGSVKYFEDSAKIDQNAETIELMYEGILRQFRLSDSFKRFYESENYIIKDNRGGTGIFLRIKN